MDVKDKVTLVTGAARGLGRAYAKALLQRGAKVVIADILEEAGRATEKEFQEVYGSARVLFVRVDLTKQDETEALFSVIDKMCGKLDLLINNAGVYLPIPDLRKTMEVNLFATIRCCELAVTRMDKKKGGKGGVIVNIASRAGILTIPVIQYYHASKHAVCGYTGSQGKFLALGESGVRIVALCPGFVRTALTQPFQDAEAAGDTDTIATVASCGGWIEETLVVKACMGLIEREVPPGAFVRVDNIKGIKMLLPEDAPYVDLPGGTLE